MNLESDLCKFAKDFQQEIIIRSEIEGEECFREDMFTQLMVEYLNDAGELDDAQIFSYRARGLQINGYCVSDDDECIDLLISINEMQTPPSKLSKSIVSAAIKRAYNFFKKSYNQLYLSLEESSDVFDLAQRIYELKNSLTKVRIFLLTDQLVNIDETQSEELYDIQISYHIWDIERLFRCWTSGKKREEIEIDFESDFSEPIPCLAMPSHNKEYNSYLMILPGKILVGLYEKYGPRLLERNVRSFLQARGNVNKGIKKTIINEPDMFLAYNNGLSATAEKVNTTSLPQGGTGISWVRDFQIVNGGQTTASIYNTFKKDKADISKIFVQVKLTVINNESKMDEIVPKISEYANSQNKVQTADFSANDPFHREIEELSRTIWAPAVDGGQRQTQWFYERARGQYMDRKGSFSTRAQKKSFEKVNPSSQKFTKTDLAKFENTWDQLPHIVSRGAQKNFKDFTVRLKERGGFKPDQRYFEHLIAKAILFKRTVKLVQAQKYGGYRANIVTYTLAWLSHETVQRIDLDRIWREQSLTSVLEELIIKTSKLVFEHITNPPNAANITEWCKKEKCWKNLLLKPLDIPLIFKNELIPVGKQKSVNVNKGINSPGLEEMKLIKDIMKVSSETWFEISSWAKETNNLASWQRGISYSLGKLASKGNQPSRKQAVQGKKILDEAEKLGFKLKYTENKEVI